VYVVPDTIESHWTWYCNGAATGGAGLDSGTPEPFGETVYVGSSGNADEHWMGDVAELLVYDRVLTASELKQVGSYLSQRYGIGVAGGIAEPDTNVKRPGNATPQEAQPTNVQ
jgi:hypothetical protein